MKGADGDGSGVPVAGRATLSANRTYARTVEVLNESATPAENTTEEIEQEDEDHPLFFIRSAALNLAVADADGKPIGLTNVVTMGATNGGTLQVTLRHEPNQSGANVSVGNLANAGGKPTSRPFHPARPITQLTLFSTNG